MRHMTVPRGRRLFSRSPLPIIIVLLWAMVVPVSTSAAALNPPPPDFETCHGQGKQTICHGVHTELGGVEPTGIFCGIGASAFEMIDSSDFVRQEATRWYDADGNLVRRTIHNVWFGGAWTNPLAGTSVRYHQAQSFVDVFAVPGDLATATETTTGALNFIAPGAGAVARATGRTVIGADGSIEFQAGPQVFIDYFVDGDPSAFDALCDALA